MGLALYRKYRPKSLADVVGQDHIVSTLQKAIKTGAISHAYLLTGPRGVGKTSIARILAHELNGLQYSDDSSHLDIIEIDAASNRRIDEIRELRDKVHIAPTSAKYKIYIIDEVHMLTREAFNALLKTLEEPPAHAIFILATTEAHKVPDTIVSRTQRFTFKPITADDTVSHLQSLAKKEGMAIEPEALQLLSEHAGGSFRDSINLLDQLGAQKDTITTTSIQQILGIPPIHMVDSLLSALNNKDTVAILSTIDTAKSEGIQAQLLAKLLLKTLRLAVATSKIKPTTDFMQLLDDLVRVNAADQPYTWLELALLKNVAEPSAATQKITTTPAINKLEAPVQAQHTPTAVVSAVPAPTRTNDLVPPTELEDQSADNPKNPIELLQDPQEYWPNLLLQIKTRYNTLYGVLRMAQPSLQDNVLTLTFGFAFHQKKINQAENVQHIAKAASGLLGRPIQVVCLLGEKQSTPNTPILPTAKAGSSAQNDPLNDISNIFEGAELLE